MRFIQFAIQNPVKVAVAVILAVLFGGIAFFSTPVRLTPEVIEPEITVTTRWRGASAQEVEEQIVEQQEEQLKNVEGLQEFESTSADSVATIVLTFPVGTDLGDASARVRDKLNQVPSYPENVDEPVITTVNPNSNAIAWFMLKPMAPPRDDVEAFVDRHPELKPVLRPMLDGSKPIDNVLLNKWAKRHPKLKSLITGRFEPAKMRKFAEDFIEARFERVPGVGNANVVGGREQEFRIIVDPEKLAAHKLTIMDLRRSLEGENRNVSGGDIREGKNRNVVRTIGLYDSPERVLKTVVAIRDNTPIKVEDVAHVSVEYMKPEGIVRRKGVDALALNAQQAPGTNLIEVMGPPLEDLDLNGDGEFTSAELTKAKQIHGDCLRIAVAELNIGPLKQQGLQIEQVYDQTDYLNSATDLVKNNIYLGGTLAVLVLLLFLRSPRSVLIVGLAIPISVIATFMFVRGFGRSINVISLAGMAFAVGMVVDSAIVVLENIFRHYQNGEDPDTASARGAKEVWGAVLASTLTTLAVFVPVIFVQGQAGQLFRDIAIAISCAVGLSLIVSITVIPTAAKRLLKPRTGEETKPEADGSQKAARSMFRRALGAVVNVGQMINNALAGFVRKLQTMPGSIFVRLGIVAFFVTASIYGAFLLAPKTEYLPEGNRNLVIALLKPPPGYSVEKMIKLGEEEIEPKLAPYWEAEPGSLEAKKLDGPLISDFFFVARGNRLFMGARAADPLKAAELVPVMNRAARGVPGTFAFATQASLFESALSGGRTIDIEITGPDLESLVTVGQQAWALCQQHFPMSEGNQLQATPSLQLSSPELHVLAKKEKAAELNLDNEELGYAVNALVDGAFAGEYWHQGRKIDLIIFGAEEHARYTHDLKDLPLATPEGKVVTLGSVADVELTSGPDQIQHKERVRTVTLQLKPHRGIPLEEALDTVDREIRQPLLESPVFESGQYQIRLAGTADKLNETRRDLQWNLVLALVITYLLMAALFESFFYPLIIMTSVILAMVGGFGGLAVLNLFIDQSLDMLTMLGFVILIGTVVNNAILIVHQALNHMRHDGLTPQDAVVESTRTRVRPIFMSTLTTVLGMAPLVLPMPDFSGGGFRWVLGAGSELYRGLGSVVLGGLIVSTIFTLVLVPTAFSLALDIKLALAKLFGFKTQELAEGAVVAMGTTGHAQSVSAETPLALRDARVGFATSHAGDAAEERETSSGNGNVGKTALEATSNSRANPESSATGDNQAPGEEQPDEQSPAESALSPGGAAHTSPRSPKR